MMITLEEALHRPNDDADRLALMRALAASALTEEREQYFQLYYQTVNRVRQERPSPTEAR